MTLARPFYVMRHGETTDNAAGLISGGGRDPDLTAAGRAQVAAVRAVFLALDPFPGALIVTALQRTHQTARLLHETVELIAEPGLNERHLGELDGLIAPEEQNRRGALPGEESAHDHRNRVKLALDRHLAMQAWPLFICHAGTIRRILELTNLRNAVPADHARIFRFAPEGDGPTWTILQH